ncbi:thermostable hemolysin [Gammaproteobacteria bacterium]|nr:thermostable hemolysin [Gammaproteobacteria bacterium]MDB4003185.1 thermostable hemolysin [Gammaproteobacteria bacterium]
MNQQSPARVLPEHSLPSQPIASESEGLPSPKISFELPVFSLFSSGQIGRKETERFIDQQFFKSYGAQHSEYMPWLISMRQQGQLSACAGVAFMQVSAYFFGLVAVFASPISRLAWFGYQASSVRTNQDAMK